MQLTHVLYFLYSLPTGDCDVRTPLLGTLSAEEQQQQQQQQQFLLSLLDCASRSALVRRLGCSWVTSRKRVRLPLTSLIVSLALGDD
jgi:hypothetical protein